MKSLLSLGLCFFGALFLSAQDSFRRDSIYIDRGVEQSTQFTPESRVYFTAYAENGRPSEVVTTRPAMNGEWLPYRRRLLSYTGRRLSQLRIQRWSEEKEMWVEFSERSFNYNPQGLLTGMLFRRAPALDEPLENVRRKLYEYTEGGAEELAQTQQWVDNTWVNERRITTTFTDSEDPQSRRLEEWNGTDWANRYLRTWIYAAGTQQNTEILSQEWMPALGDWQNMLRRELVYDANGFWIGSLYQRWDTAADTWENNAREIHQLNNANVLDNFVFQVWLNGEWVNGTREVNYQEESLFGSIIQRWDEQGADWENWERYQTTLTAEALLAETLERQTWNRDQELWLNNTDTRRLSHFWSDATVGTDAAPLRDLACVFSNPYGPGSTIQCDELPAAGTYTLELYDLSGRQLFAQPLQTGIAVRLPDRLSAGTYFLRIREGRRLLFVEKVIFNP